MKNGLFHFKKNISKKWLFILILCGLITNTIFLIVLPAWGNLLVAEFADFYHPLPGYDAKYRLRISENGVPMPISLYNVALPGNINMENDIITIPYDIWSTTDQIEINVSSKINPTKIAHLCYAPMKYNLTFNDDFDFYDPTKWTPFLDNWGEKVAVIHENQMEIRDGVLVLKAEKKQYNIDNKTYNYTREAIATQNTFNQRFGLFTSNVKMPQAPGILTAFWLWIKHAIPGANGYMVKLDGPEGKHCNEFDIFEYAPGFSPTGNMFWFSQHFYWGDNDKYHDNLSYEGKTLLPMFDEFNEISLLWTTDFTALYINGKMVFKTAVNSNNGNSAFMILSMYAGLSDSNWQGNAMDEYFPYEFLVDFTRVYQIL